MEKPTYSALAHKTGLSRSYACEIVNGTRTPSRPLAIHIFRRTGWKHPRLADLTDEQLAMLEGIEPWQGEAA